MSLGTAASPNWKSECTGTSQDSCCGQGQNIKNYYWGGRGGGIEFYLTALHCVYVLPLSWEQQLSQNSPADTGCNKSAKLSMEIKRKHPVYYTQQSINLLTPNVDYSGRTTPITSKRCILYIYSTNTDTEYFKHGIYCPFFLFKMQFVS